jgi:TAG lipase/steryl ester hydrolase/phospholipase A2/LPA acyltransferase
MKANRRRQQTALVSTLRSATTFSEWRAARLALEQFEGVSEQIDRQWEASSLVKRLRADRLQLENMQRRNPSLALADWLTQSLYRTLAELSDDRLYAPSELGSHAAIGAYLDSVCDTLDTLCDTAIPGMTEAQKLAHLQNAEHNLGIPALLLSGGGTFGIYHLGVVKTLLENHLLPEVISGTSMGSIVAGMLATHTDAELAAILQTPRTQHHTPLVSLPWRQILSQRVLLDQERLRECVLANLGAASFAEAYQKTGRTVSITVSPTRAGQKPRILNHLTAPDVLIAEACIASCAIPLLYPPVLLQARRGKGIVHPYAEEERWADGSFATDIPRQRLSRLCNVNFFVVSQANPHILPFATHRQQNGVVATLRDMTVTTSYHLLTGLLDVGRRRVDNPSLRRLLEHADAFLDQDYFGDITIHPRFGAAWFLKFMKNPSDAELDYLVLTGEQATWPKLARLHEQTRINRKVRECIRRLEEKRDAVSTRNLHVV